MALPNSFSNNTAPTGPELDDNFSAVGALAVIPCTVAGTNTITMAANSNTPTINAYANYLRISGVAAATNTGPTTARLGALGALNVYRDTPAGPVALAGGEIVIGCAFTLVYDSALNTGTGGWHLVSVANALPYTGVATNSTLSFVNGTLSTLILTGASLSAPTLIVSGPASLASLNVSGLASAATLAGSSLGTFAKLMVGASAASVTRILSGIGTLAFTVVPAATAQDQDMALAGVQLGDSIALGYTVGQTNALFGGYVPAAGTVAVRCLNGGAASLAAFTLVARATAHGFT